jgi:hypothetical protein
MHKTLSGRRPLPPPPAISGMTGGRSAGAAGSWDLAGPGPPPSGVAGGVSRPAGVASSWDWAGPGNMMNDLGLLRDQELLPLGAQSPPAHVAPTNMPLGRHLSAAAASQAPGYSGHSNAMAQGGTQTQGLPTGGQHPQAFGVPAHQQPQPHLIQRPEEGRDWQMPAQHTALTRLPGGGLQQEAGTAGALRDHLVDIR